MIRRLRQMGVTAYSRLPAMVAMTAVAALAAGCASAGNQVPAARHAPAATRAEAVIRAPAASSGPPISHALAGPGKTARFVAAGLSFRYPVGWRAATWSEVSSFSALIVAVSTTPQHNPCAVTVGDGKTTAVCAQPVAALPPGKILVEWTARGFPDWLPPAPNTVVGGHPARETSAMASWCAALRGTQTITVVIPLGAEAGNWYQMDACLRAPDLPRGQAQLAAMLATVRITG